MSHFAKCDQPSCDSRTPLAVRGRLQSRDARRAGLPRHERFQKNVECLIRKPSSSWPQNTRTTESTSDKAVIMPWAQLVSVDLCGVRWVWLVCAGHIVLNAAVTPALAAQTTKESPSDEIAHLTEWVRQGTPWPADDPPAAIRPQATFDLEKRRREHWAWQPIRVVAPPRVHDRGWAHNAVD